MSESNDPKKKIVIAIDIEKTLRTLTEGIVAIGVVVASKESDSYTVLEKITFCMPFPEDVKDSKLMDQEAWSQFWSNPKFKLEKVIERIKREAIPYEKSLKEFVEFFDGIEERFPEHEIEIISDNPPFDIGSIDGALDVTKTRKLPIKYNKTGKKYRSVIDPGERLDSLSMWHVATSIVDKKVDHDHWPSNDALHHLYMAEEAEKIQKFLKDEVWDFVDKNETRKEKNGTSELREREIHTRLYHNIVENEHFQLYRESKKRKSE